MGKWFHTIWSKTSRTQVSVCMHIFVRRPRLSTLPLIGVFSYHCDSKLRQNCQGKCLVTVEPGKNLYGEFLSYRRNKSASFDNGLHLMQLIFAIVCDFHYSSHITIPDLLCFHWVVFIDMFSQYSLFFKVWILLVSYYNVMSHGKVVLEDISRQLLVI